MKRILFLGSGGGGNLKFIHSYFQDSRNIFEIVSVITDRNCGASEYAMQNNIPNYVLSFSRDEIGDKQLIDLINKFSPDFIITNVHRILSKRVVAEFNGKLLNLHYSYLPAFGGVIGMTPVNQAIERGNLFVGCTMHFVTEEVDAGKTISQGIIIKKESQNIYQSVFECGALTLTSGLLELNGQGNLNFKFLNEYIISPFSSKIDMNLTQSIFSKLKN